MPPSPEALAAWRRARAAVSARAFAPAPSSWLARPMYEAGYSLAAIHARTNMPASAVYYRARREGWDVAERQRNAPDRRYPWRAAVRPRWEAGESYAALESLTGLRENTIAQLAKRWGWDGAARWDAIWRTARGGVSKDEARRTRRQKHRQERRLIDRGSKKLPLGHLRQLRAAARLCPYCGLAIAPGNATLDHIDPIAGGGTNDPDNLIACCARCNRSKSDRVLVVWLARRALRRRRRAD